MDDNVSIDRPADDHQSQPTAESLELAFNSGLDTFKAYFDTLPEEARLALKDAFINQA
ncbi:hypothetical protein N2382_06975 [SAR92 clade bacterium H921]|jgi:hypothetical protein|nr:hypothetical protein [SAR92 clade bacterium H921]MDG0970713.1 hypothetical protein [Porticoccaceae bacterium]MDG1308673.1 hypothetical protein [Porticoccaceae bacterium]